MYGLERSTNLLDWVRLDTAAVTSNMFHFIDTAALTVDQRFHRATQAR